MSMVHTKGLHRGYADNLRVEWEQRGKGGHSSITLLNAKKRPVAVLLGDYVPGECDADMDAAARLFCAAPDLLAALISTRASLQAMADEGIVAEGSWPTIDAAIAKATTPPVKTGEG